MTRNIIRRTAIGLALALSAVSCGSSTDPAETAAETAETTTTTAPAETTTTTEATTTTAEPTTTTEPPVAGEAEAFGDPLAAINGAVGQQAPTIEGYDYLTTDPVSWGSDGPAAVLFAPLADWCPHCSIHLGQVTDYLAENDGPGTAQVLLVTSDEQPSGQHPQDEWLTDRGWPFATVLETLDISIATAFGITNVPTWVLVGSDGTVTEVVDGHHVTPADVFAKIDALE